LLRPPELIWSSNQGLGMAVAQSLGLEKDAQALKSELGLTPNELRVSFYWEDGTLRSLVNGVGEGGSEFGEVLDQKKEETLMDFVSRSALTGVAELSPYYTAVYLLQAHSDDKNFEDLINLIERNVSITTPAHINPDKSLYDNLLGLVALFKNDPNSAEAEFVSAMTDDPSNPVGFINLAFVDLQQNDYQSAANRMEQLVRLAPPSNQMVLGSAYMTWAAALMGLHDLAGADRLLAAATAAAPHAGTAFGLWSDLKRLQGDEKTADRLQQRAEQEGTPNYAEIALLYFQLAWRDNRPVELNPLNNPDVVIRHRPYCLTCTPGERRARMKAG
jgi:tetratricopeptide (TPR) repeat protein